MHPIPAPPLAVGVALQAPAVLFRSMERKARSESPSGRAFPFIEGMLPVHGHSFASLDLGRGPHPAAFLLGGPMRIPFWAWWFISAIALLLGGAMISAAQAQQYRGYAWYPSYYGSGYYRAPYYGGGLPYRGYNGYHMADRPAYRPPVYRYNWQAMKLPCRGCWPREW
jgi:hypothetical protein